MTGASLQFHATNSEVVAMAAAWAREFSLPAGLGTLFGDQAVADRPVKRHTDRTRKT